MYKFKSGSLEMELNECGFFSSIKVCGKEIAVGKNPIITLCRDGKICFPEKANVNGNTVTVDTEIGEIMLSVAETENCITLEIVSVPDETYAAVFGPYTVSINEVIGEVIGVAQGNGVAFGIQSLNIKTIEGVPQIYADEYKKLNNYVSGSVKITVCDVDIANRTASQIEEGVAINLYCKRRDITEHLSVHGEKNSLVLPLAEGDSDAKIAGAKMAFFGCEQKKALETIGKIEIEQGLPHPMFNGEWGKTARSAMASYLISDYADSDAFDMVTDSAIKAGMKYIYHIEPQKNWGHFEWLESLAANDEEMRKLVDRAESKGVHVGTHTLSNFTTTNDPYVTPVPDEHLLKMGFVELLCDIAKDATTIELPQTELFEHPLTLNTVQIGNELIRYASYKTENGTTVLNDCTRGAFGTTVAEHKKGDTVYRLWDYPYNTFFPDIILQDKFTDRIAELFNNCNLSQISFDGLEGCGYTGHNTYAENRFVKGCWDKWDHNVLNDASRLSHYTWHIHTRMNWGEPWGEEMRTGQVEGRIRNQDYFRRNLFPRMLGWFLIRLAEKKFECSTLEDLEWALSEAAGFDAGYSMTIYTKTLKNHGRINQFLETMKNWDILRYANVFTDEQKAKLRDPATEWHLEKINDKEFELYPVNVSKHYTCMLSELQPGQPGGSDWIIDGHFAGKAAVRLKVDGDGCIKNPSFQTSNGVIKFPCEIEDGQYLLFDFNGNAEVTDKNYKTIEKVVPQGSFTLAGGHTSVSFACDHAKDETPDIDIRFITRGEPEKIAL